MDYIHLDIDKNSAEQSLADKSTATVILFTQPNSDIIDASMVLGDNPFTSEIKYHYIHFY